METEQDRDDQEWWRIVAALKLNPHPEGGFFRETFRSAIPVEPLDDRGRRVALTTIDFLLPPLTFSRWHRVASDEVWHHLRGGVLELAIMPPSLDSLDVIRLQPAMTGPHCHTVPAGWWQAARPADQFVLSACTVGPGFEFDDFSFLADEPTFRDDADGTHVRRLLGPDWAKCV